MLGKGRPWQPGEKLKLLFAGYNGTRNMGSDVRVEEMLRQIRHILGAERVAFSVMTQNSEILPRIFRRHRAGSSSRYFSAFLVGRSSEASWRGGMRRLDVQEQVRQCADHHDDWIAGHCRGAEQTFGWLRSRGRAHGSVGRQNVRPLLPELAGDHAQRRIAYDLARTWRAHRTRHRYGLDF